MERATRFVISGNLSVATLKDFAYLYFFSDYAFLGEGAARKRPRALLTASSQTLSTANARTRSPVKHHAACYVTSAVEEESNLFPFATRGTAAK